MDVQCYLQSKVVKREARGQDEKQHSIPGVEKVVTLQRYRNIQMFTATFLQQVSD